VKKPVVFLDADVIFAGAAAPTEHGASHVVLRMAEITLIECVTSQQAVTEVVRNFEQKLPEKLPELQLILRRCLRVVPDPAPETLAAHEGQADPKDLPIMVAALMSDCRYLLTFNLRHYHPPVSEIAVQRPGDFLVTVRSLLAQMETETPEGD
jgi:predicted nucleic acid-binding protein